MNAAEKRGYSKGYNAGIKRRAREIERLNRDLKAAGESKRERVFCACLSGLLAGVKSWTVGDNPVNNAETYADLAEVFTDTAIRKL